MNGIYLTLGLVFVLSVVYWGVTSASSHFKRKRSLFVGGDVPLGADIILVCLVICLFWAA